MAIRGVCAHCESDQATMGFSITGLHEREGFCCDHNCFKAYFRGVIGNVIQTKIGHYETEMKRLKRYTVYPEYVPFVTKYRRAFAVSSRTFAYLLKRDEGNYRLFRSKGLEEWVELLELCPSDGELKYHADKSKEFFELCKTAQRYFFPHSSF